MRMTRSDLDAVGVIEEFLRWEELVSAMRSWFAVHRVQEGCVGWRLSTVRLSIIIVRVMILT